MRLVAIGISHHTAPVELREKLAMAPERMPEVLEALRSDGVGREGLVLSTCNRVERGEILEALQLLPLEAASQHEEEE